MGLYNKDFLFIHIPKTGGYSVKRWLLDVLPECRMPKLGGFDLAPEQIDARLPIGHIPLKDIERFTERPPDSWKLIVGIVRNPYDQQLSQWLYWRDRYARGGRHFHDLVAASYPTLTGFLMDHRADFHLWYESVHGSIKQTYTLNQAYGFLGYQTFGGYYRYWLSVDGRLPENVRLVRLEEVDTVLPGVLRDFGIVDADELPAIPRENVTAHHHPTPTYYTPLGARIVEAKFAWTFDQRIYARWDYGLKDDQHVIA